MFRSEQRPPPFVICFTFRAGSQKKSTTSARSVTLGCFQQGPGKPHFLSFFPSTFFSDERQICAHASAPGESPPLSCPGYLLSYSPSLLTRVISPWAAFQAHYHVSAVGNTRLSFIVFHPRCRTPSFLLSLLLIPLPLPCGLVCNSAFGIKSVKSRRGSSSLARRFFLSSATRLSPTWRPLQFSFFLKAYSAAWTGSPP